jgi:hypothetical protein
VATLEWKSYGDTGRTAKGACGMWIVVTDGIWWYLNLRPHNEHTGGSRHGKFITRLAAESQAQDYEAGNHLIDL